MRLLLIWFSIALGLAVLAYSGLPPNSVLAQVTLELGNTVADIKRSMASQGYTDIVIIKRKFVATTVEGCRGGIRYRLKILLTGDTKWRQEVGKCRNQIDIDQARALLVKQGYNRIDIEARRNTFVAIACLDRDRLRVSVDRFGEVRQQRRIGSCRSNALSLSDIKADLKQQGYTRIKFVDRQLPRYVAEACLGLTRVELVLSRDGDIRREAEIGRCRRAIDPRNLVKILQQDGFDRVKIIDNKLPRYVAEACRRNRSIEVTLNRFGKIIDQFELGQCKPRMNRNQLLAWLKGQRVSRTKIISQNNGIYIVKLCDGEAKMNITYNIFGEVLKRKKVGICASRTVSEITKILARRKMTGTKIFAEGCIAGKKVRMEFNRAGDPIGRKRLGAC